MAEVRKTGKLYEKMRAALLAGSALSHHITRPFSKLHRAFVRDPNMETPVSDMRTYTGLLTAYWRSPGQRDAYLYAAGIGALSFLIGANAIRIGLEYAETFYSLSHYHTLGPDAFSNLKNNVVDATILTAEQVGMVVGRHLISSNLHRKWTGWLRNQFAGALLNEQNTAHHLRYALVKNENGEIESLKSIEQRIADCTKSTPGTVIGLTMGAITTASSLASSVRQLIVLSTPMKGLDFMGSWGTFGISMVTGGTSVAAGTFLATRFDKMITGVNQWVQETEARLRDNFSTIARNGFYIAASGGQDLEKKNHDAHYKATNKAWIYNNNVTAGFMGFMGLYNPFSKHIVSYLPGLPSYLMKQIGFDVYLKGCSVTGSLINSMDWFIDITPARAALKADLNRLIDVAEAVHAVRAPKAFYLQRGICEFIYQTQQLELGLLVQNMQLMHEGHDAQPFLKIPHIVLRPGDRAEIVGRNGAGKSCFLKAIAGQYLWPFGRGMVAMSKEAKLFFATQDIEMQSARLKELITYRLPVQNFTDERIENILEKVGLENFKPHLHKKGKDDKGWNSLSGGEKQKIVLARILLEDPDILLLDEADSALDVAARTEFYKILDENLKDRPGRSNAIILSIVHQASSPRLSSGERFFTHTLDIEDGVMTQKRSSHPTRSYVAQKGTPPVGSSILALPPPAPSM